MRRLAWLLPYPLIPYCKKCAKVRVRAPLAKKLFSLLGFPSDGTPSTSACRTSWPRFHPPMPSVAPCILKVRVASSLTTYPLLQEVCQSAGSGADCEKTFFAPSFSLNGYPFTSACRTSWPRFHPPVPSVAPGILNVWAASSFTTYTLLQEVCHSAGWAALGEKTFFGLPADPGPGPETSQNTGAGFQGNYGTNP